MSKHEHCLASARTYLTTVILTNRWNHKIAILDILHNYWSLNTLLQTTAQQILDKLETLPFKDFCAALNAVFVFDSTLITGHHLAQLTTRLLQHETTPGGPYATDTAPDIATNAIVARFAYLQHGELPGVRAFLENAPLSHLSLYHVWLLCRAHLPGMIDYFTQRLSNNATDPLLELVFATRPLNASEKQVLYHRQQADGSWPASMGFSKEIMTALVYRTLANTPAPAAPDWRPLQSVLFEQIEAEFATTAPSLKERAQYPLQKLRLADAYGEISMFAYFFSLKSPIPERTVLVLGKANLLVWLAYSLYDDLLDNDSDPQYLPLANLALRRAMELYRQATPTTFYKFILQTFDTMDKANDWELSYCRTEVQDNHITIIEQLPDYDKNHILAMRAGAHSLGPLAVLVLHGWKVEEDRFQVVLKGLEHYLIARQLNDDLYDWKQDLLAGRLSHAVSSVLVDIKIGKKYYLPSLLPQLEQYFWRTALQQECRLVLYHIHNAKKLVQSQVPLTPAFSYFLDTIESTTLTALHTSKQQHEFLAFW